MHTARFSWTRILTRKSFRQEKRTLINVCLALYVLTLICFLFRGFCHWTLCSNSPSSLLQCTQLTMLLRQLTSTCGLPPTINTYFKKLSFTEDGTHEANVERSGWFVLGTRFHYVTRSRDVMTCTKSVSEGWEGIRSHHLRAHELGATVYRVVLRRAEDSVDWGGEGVASDEWLERWMQMTKDDLVHSFQAGPTLCIVLVPLVTVHRCVPSGD